MNNEKLIMAYRCLLLWWGCKYKFPSRLTNCKVSHYHHLFFRNQDSKLQLNQKKVQDQFHLDLHASEILQRLKGMFYHPLAKCQCYGQLYDCLTLDHRLQIFFWHQSDHCCFQYLPNFSHQSFKTDFEQSKCLMEYVDQ